MKRITIKHLLAAIIFGQLLIFAGLLYVGGQIAELDYTVDRSIWGVGGDIDKTLGWISDKLGSIASK